MIQEKSRLTAYIFVLEVLDAEVGYECRYVLLLAPSLRTAQFTQDKTKLPISSSATLYYIII